MDSNRERNVGIVLQFLRLPIQTIEASVRTFDELTLGEEHMSGLAKIIPTNEDLQLIERWMKRNPKATTAQLHQLSIPVRFFMMTLKIDYYAERVQCWNFKNEFKGRIEDLEVKLRRALEGVTASMEAPHLPRMLQFILAVSNFLNTGSRFQEAKGFPISQLPHIIAFPTTDNKRVLLDYLIEIIDKQDPEVHQCTKELLPAVAMASNFDVPGVAGEVKALRTRMQKCGTLVRAIPDDKPWTTKLGRFIYNGLPMLERLEQLVSDLNAKIEKMPAFFCENPTSFSMNDTLRCLTTFAKKYDARREENQQKEVEKQERLARAAAKKAESLAAGHSDDSSKGPNNSHVGRPPPQRREQQALSHLSPKGSLRQNSGGGRAPQPPASIHDKDTRINNSGNFNGSTGRSNGHAVPASGNSTAGPNNGRSAPGLANIATSKPMHSAVNGPKGNGGASAPLVDPLH
ncbi:putative formin [Trypanosoma grayi]|uniref:putative formin n=1 Tax=Trypanosoma grayi TaxID=71804 RepID=UPI0004F4B754|nr:putative formin [Trypanosoma grayi]KEG11152.1 putative formin [Trypanosoma grayi]